MNAEGDAAAIWWQANSNNVFANTFSPLDGWATPTPLGNNSTGRPYDPVVAAAGHGAFYAAWANEANQDVSVWVARFDQATGWGGPALVSPAQGRATTPLIAADPGGNATILWRQVEGPSRPLWASLRTEGQTWTTPFRLSPDNSTNTTYYTVVSDGMGAFYAAWDQDNATGHSVWWNKLPPAGDWANATEVDLGNATDAFSPTLAADPSGNLTIAYRQANGTFDDLFVVQYTPGSGWTTPFQFAPIPGTARMPVIAAGPIGETVVAWTMGDYRGETTHGSVWAAHFTPTTNRPVAVRLNPSKDEPAGDPVIEFGPDGNATVVWPQSNGTHFEPWASRYAGTSGWSAAVSLLPTERGAYYAAVAGDMTGRALSVVEQDNFAGVRIVAFAFGFPTYPPLTLDAPPDGAQRLESWVMVRGRTCPGYAVTVQGRATAVGADGSFSENVTLSQGPTGIVVNATSPAGLSTASNVTVSHAVAPGPPGNLTARGSHLAVDLNWEVPAADGGAPPASYRIYRNSTGSSEALVGTATGNTAFRDGVNASKTNYTYRVAAVNWAGEGNRSSPASATPRTTPSAPLNVRTSPGNGQVLLEWSPPSDDGGAPILEYRLYRGAQSGQLLLIANGSELLRFTDTGLSNGASYFYQVSAVNDAGEGNRTAELAIRLPGGFLPGFDPFALALAALIVASATRRRRVDHP